MKHVDIFVVVGLLMAGVVMGEEKEIVVSATRLETDAASVASSVTVISGTEIEKQQKTTMVDILKNIPGVHVMQNGGLGTTANVQIRGAKSEQVLVLVDGVEMNDPIAPGRGAYLANIDLENIERIEVLRGPQSALYGSDSIAGVISISTKKGKGDPSAYVSAEAGSFSTFKESAGLSGESGNRNYSVSVTRIDSEGISAAEEDDGNTEEDGFKHTSVSARFGVEHSDQLQVDLILRYINSETEFDDGGGVGGDAEDNLSKRESLFLRAQGKLDLFDSLWIQNLGVSVAPHDRSSDSAWGKSTFDSQLIKVDWQNNVYIGDANVFVAGVEYEREEGKTDTVDKQSVDTISVFVQDQAELSDSLNIVVGGRLDSHEEFGEEVTYRIGPVYNMGETGTRIKATYGTGFKAPSLYQLYAPASSFGPIGNEELDPETSVSWDVGIEQEFSERNISVGVTYFSSDFKDMIDFETGYVNKSKAQVRGAEVFSRFQPCDALDFNVSYTWMETEDKDTGEDLIRRPDHRVSAGLDYAFNDKASVGLSVLYVGERDDRYYSSSMFGTMESELSDYTVVNITGLYDINDNIRVFARIDNLFDEDYQEITGYGTPGLSAYGGVKINI